jgi:hypothetical protein
LDGSRRRGPLLAGMFLMIGFNIVFNMAYFNYQGTRIATADYFVPTFRKMESVRQRLKADAGVNYRVRIDDASFRKTMTRKYTEGVMDLAQYVDLREQYDPFASRARQVKTYQVRVTSEALNANERVVCATNGVAFVAED